MRIVVYWARAEGAHPNASVAANEACWQVMHRRVKALGYDLTLLTAFAEKTALPHDHRIDFSVDPNLCILAREHAWSQYLTNHLKDGEQAAMIEPDCYLLRQIPPLADGKNLMLLRRDKPPLPACFRLARSSAAPYYVEMLRRTLARPPASHRWGGDCEAQHEMVPDPTNPPSELYGARIEVRDSRDYCFDDRRSNKDAVAWMFNGGKKKQRMLSLR